MDKGFICGVILGAVAISAYAVGEKTKNAVVEQKSKIKEKINKFLD